MLTMTKSQVALAREAKRIASTSMETYSSRF